MSTDNQSGGLEKGGLGLDRALKGETDKDVKLGLCAKGT